MKIQIDKRYPLPCDADVAWRLLQDLEAVAGCMPGAKITERLDGGRYKGTVTARVGPATLSFRGEVARQDVDPAARSLRLVGKGTDSTGTSGASMSIVARVEGTADGRSALVGSSEMSLSGKAATFGGRLMNPVAEQILGQFAANFAAQAGALEAQRGAPAGAAPPVAPAARELNVLALAWSLLRGWLRRLFSRKAA